MLLQPTTSSISGTLIFMLDKFVQSEGGGQNKIIIVWQLVILDCIRLVSENYLVFFPTSHSRPP